MKIFNLLLLSTIVAMLFFSSCVSSKKLEAAEKEKKELKKQLTDAKSACDKEKKQLTSEKNKYQKELETVRKDLNLSIDDVEKLISQRQATREINKKMYDDLKLALAGTDTSLIQVEIRDCRVRVIISNKLLYKGGSDQPDKSAYALLDIIAGTLIENQGMEALIESHTDDEPVKGSKYNTNWELTAARAKSILTYFIKQGMEEARLTGAGRGEYRPVAENETPEGKLKNRRTVITLSSDLNAFFDILKTDI